MKLIALKDFANNAQLEIDSAIHERHIHKGATFEVGTAKELKELKAAEKVLVAQLIVAGCVGDATDEKVVKGVKEAVEQDKKRDANAKKLDQQAAGTALVEQLTQLLQKASAAAAPAK